MRFTALTLVQRVLIVGVVSMLLGIGMAWLAGLPILLGVGVGLFLLTTIACQ